jgi:hypothetical protein
MYFELDSSRFDDVYTLFIIHMVQKIHNHLGRVIFIGSDYCDPYSSHMKAIAAL